MAWAPTIISFLILFDVGYGVLIPPPFGWARSKTPQQMSQNSKRRSFDFSIGTFPPIPWHGKSGKRSARPERKNTKLNDVRHEKPHVGLGNEVITRSLHTDNPGLTGTIVVQNEDYAQRILTPLEQGNEVAARFGNTPKSGSSKTRATPVEQFAKLFNRRKKSDSDGVTSSGFGDYGRGGYGYYGHSPMYDYGDSYYSDDDYGLPYPSFGSPKTNYDSLPLRPLFERYDPTYGLPEHGYNPAYGYDPLDFDYTIYQRERPEYYPFDDVVLRMEDSGSKKRKKKRKSKRGSNRRRGRRRDK